MTEIEHCHKYLLEDASKYSFQATKTLATGVIDNKIVSNNAQGGLCFLWQTCLKNMESIQCFRLQMPVWGLFKETQILKGDLDKFKLKIVYLGITIFQYQCFSIIRHIFKGLLLPFGLDEHSSVVHSAPGLTHLTKSKVKGKSCSNFHTMALSLLITRSVMNLKLLTSFQYPAIKCKVECCDKPFSMPEIVQTVQHKFLKLFNSILTILYHFRRIQS